VRIHYERLTGLAITYATTSEGTAFVYRNGGRVARGPFLFLLVLTEIFWNNALNSPQLQPTTTFPIHQSHKFSHLAIYNLCSRETVIK
jgi:hypothetical protein